MPPALREAAPLLVAATVLALLVGGTLALRAGDGPGSPGGGPPVLRLVEQAGGSVSAAAAGPGLTVAPSARFPGGPDRASTYELPATDPDESRVKELATALGLRGSVGRTPEGLTVRDGTAELTVARSQGHPWWFTRHGDSGCLPEPGVGPGVDGTVSCTPGAGTGDPPMEGSPLPSTSAGAEQARRAAGTVVSALGQEVSEADVEVTGDGVALTVDPVVDDRRTAGMPVSVAAGPDGVRMASGWLAEPVEGDAYPLIGAEEALDAAVRPAAPQSAPVSGERQVVAARLGLSLAWAQGDRPLLVPAWLYEVAGLPRPVVVVAVDPAYLAPVRNGGTPVPVEPGGGIGGGAGPPDEPGEPEPVRPPDGDGTGADEPATRFETVVLSRSGRSLTARFYGGVEDCYDYRLTAEESGRRVVLHLTETATTDGACIELAQEYERTVALREPLGERVVVDAETGHEILLRRPRD